MTVPDNRGMARRLPTAHPGEQGPYHRMTPYFVEQLWLSGGKRVTLGTESIRTEYAQHPQAMPRLSS